MIRKCFANFYFIIEMFYSYCDLFKISTFKFFMFLFYRKDNIHAGLNVFVSFSQNCKKFKKICIMLDIRLYIYFIT